MKHPTIWIVNDEEYERKAISQDVRERIPLCTLKLFNDYFDVVEETTVPDVIIIDMTTIHPMRAGVSIHAYYSPIFRLIDLFTGTTIVITSAHEGWVKDIVNDIKDRSTESDVRGYTIVNIGDFIDELKEAYV